MADEAGDPPAAHTSTHERSFPLNSRRLTASVIGQISLALAVPTGGSLEDTRRMLEGKLAEAGREPRNVPDAGREAGRGWTRAAERASCPGRDERGSYHSIRGRRRRIYGDPTS